MLYGTTFGFEAEYGENAEELANELRRTPTPVPGAVTIHGDPGLHSYHCRCRGCGSIDESNSPVFRAQTDATCAGEIISRVFTNLDQARPAFQVLQDAAVAADATPGLNAGFHVHVQPRGVLPQYARLIYAFFEEPLLELVAPGRFDRVSGMNQSYSLALHGHIGAYFEQQQLHGPTPDGTMVRFVRYCYIENDEGSIVVNPTRQGLIDLLTTVTMSMDRHLSWSLVTRYATVEHRLWRSTRSAWRMELFVGLSRALSDPRILVELLAYMRAQRPDRIPPSLQRAHFLGDVIRGLDPDLGALYDRQLDYSRTQASNAPPLAA